MRLSDEDIHLWQIDLQRSASEHTLSADEQERAARLKIPQARARFIAGRVALRQILAKYTSQTLQFIYGEHGKPALFNSGLHFNLAHSEDRALLALARHPIGVDLERIRPLKEMAYIVRTAFTEGEQERLATLPADQQESTFFRLWTCKEAAMKALGGGFRLAQEIEIALNEHPHLIRLGDENVDEWTLAVVPDQIGFAAAYVVKKRGIRSGTKNYPD
jgi:4'-phosphopantetheinyl transferase